MAISGTTPGASTDNERWSVAGPDEPAADRSAHIEFITRTELVGEKGGYLAVGEALNSHLYLR
jgi:hypothetical protein